MVWLGRNWKKNTEPNKELKDHNFIQMILNLTKTYDSLTQIMTSKLKRWKPTYVKSYQSMKRFCWILSHHVRLFNCNVPSRFSICINLKLVEFNHAVIDDIKWIWIPLLKDSSKDDGDQTHIYIRQPRTLAMCDFSATSLSTLMFSMDRRSNFNIVVRNFGA